MTHLEDSSLRRSGPALVVGAVVASGLTLTVTRFPDPFARRLEQETRSWESLVGEVSDPPIYSHKKACPLIKLGTFGTAATAAGSLRSNENMLLIYGIEGDYDAGALSLSEAAERLRRHGIAAVLYSTPSHSAERPRWRVLAPLSAPHIPKERWGLVAALNFALDGVLAPESFVDSQAYYIGAVEGVPYCFEEVKGEPIDIRAPNLGSREPASARPVGNGPVDPDAEAFSQLGAAPGVTDLTIEDLRSALSVNPVNQTPWIDPASRDNWIRVGQALKKLDDEGKGLWMTWSSLSPKFWDGRQDPDLVWDSLKGDYTDYRAVFAAAQRGGWVNPGRRRLTKLAEQSELIDRTDLGNLAVLAQVTDGNLRYVFERKTWIQWDGSTWRVDRAGSLSLEAAKRVAAHLFAQADEIQQRADHCPLGAQDEKRFAALAKSLRSWAEKSRNRTQIDNMLELAKRDARFSISVSELDKDPLLLGVANGVVDLNTGKLRPAAREDFVTKRSPIAYVAGAEAPRFLQFMEEITALPIAHQKGAYTARPHLLRYLQLALGYSLTASTAEHKMFIAVGSGANGKNVLLDLVQYVLGDYCQAVSPQMWMSGKYDADPERATPGARQLEGARMVSSSEVKAGQNLAAAIVKRHTGGGFMTARGLHEMPVTFLVTHKLWIMTNHVPGLDQADDAIANRLHVIPFDMRWNRPGTVVPDTTLPDGDKGLPSQLQGEAEGVLAWLVQGAKLYLKDGLVPPPEVVLKTGTYLEDQDPFAEWLSGYDRCPVDSGIGSAILHQQFIDWCEENEVAGAVSSSIFAARLEAKGVEWHKFNTGKRWGLKKLIITTEFDGLPDGQQALPPPGA